MLTKTDFYPEWRRTLDLDRTHLRDAGVDAEIIPVSSTLRRLALESGDEELDAESGFPALVRYVQREVIGAAERLSVRATLHDASAVVERSGRGRVGPCRRSRPCRGDAPCARGRPA